MAAVCMVANGAERPVPSGAGKMAPGMGLKADGAKRQQVSAPNALHQGAGAERTRRGRRSGPMANRSRMDRPDGALWDAIDNADSYAELSRLMMQAMGSRNPEVRQAMVDALADKGRKAANDLAYFITDRDDDVAASAFSAWVSILEEHGTPGRAAAIISAARIIQQNSSPAGMQAPPGVPPSQPVPAPAYH